MVTTRDTTFVSGGLLTVVDLLELNRDRTFVSGGNLTVISKGDDWHADSDTLLDAFTGSPTIAERELYDGLIRQWNEFDIWNDCDAIYVPAITHDNAADALLNWKSPGTLDAVLAGSPVPTFAASAGLTTDGSQNKVQFLNPATQATLFARDSHFIFMLATSAQSVGASLFGWYDGTDGFTMTPGNNTSTALQFRASQAANTLTGTGVVTGTYNHMAINRSAASGAGCTQVYLDGVVRTQVTNTNQTSAALNNHVLQFGSITDASFRAGTLHMLLMGRSMSAQKMEDTYLIARSYAESIGLQ